MNTRRNGTGNNVNMAAVTRQLLDLIMKLSTDDRLSLLKKLKKPGQTVYSAKNKASATTELIDAIMKTTMEKRCELLGELKALAGTSKRKYSRMEYFVSIQFLHRNRMFNGYIRNISKGGAFIEVSKADLGLLALHETLSMNFDHPDTRRNIKVTGRIVRLTNVGMGVRFDDTI